MQDLAGMRLVITDFTADPELGDAVTRYHALMQISFSSTSLYKIIETESSQVLRFSSPAIAAPQIVGLPAQAPLASVPASQADLNVKCVCGTTSSLQANLIPGQPLEGGKLAFPPNDNFVCPTCGMSHNLRGARLQIEAQTKQKIIA